jgi:hypothetical protein
MVAVFLLLTLLVDMLVVISFMVVVGIAVELVLVEFDCDEERVGRLLVVLIGGRIINEEGNDADADDDKGRSRLRRWCSVMVAIGCVGVG